MEYDKKIQEFQIAQDKELEEEKAKIKNQILNELKEEYAQK